MSIFVADSHLLVSIVAFHPSCKTCGLVYATLIILVVLADYFQKNPKGGVKIGLTTLYLSKYSSPVLRIPVRYGTVPYRVQRKDLVALVPTVARMRGTVRCITTERLP